MRKGKNKINKIDSVRVK